ncbi:hypothetical protein EBZ39_13440 [bacterium]|nr:hypothetical protein [bacterium]
MNSALPPNKGEESVAYLEVPQEQRVAVPETVWCKIGEDNQLEFIRWDLINVYAAQYDADKNARDQTRVMCKLLTLVRDQVRKEMSRE